MPNIPQAVIVFYALNRLGAVPAMIHPLSAPAEIRAYAPQTALHLGGHAGFLLPALCRGEGTEPDPADAPVQGQRVHGAAAFTRLCADGGPQDAEDRAGPGIFPGRTSRRSPPRPPSWKHPDPLSPSGARAVPVQRRDHGRLQGHHALQPQLQRPGHPDERGGRTDPARRLDAFHPADVSRVRPGGRHPCHADPRGTLHPGAAVQRQRALPGWSKKYKPGYLAGVPTLFDALSANAAFNKTNLSCFKGLFCGGDSLSRQTKERFEAVLRKNGGNTPLREGYGLTESVTANILMPRDHYRERSIGVPYPDMLGKVVRLDTTVEADPNEEGEICVSGPTLMLGYLDDPEETAVSLRRHEDGLLWLHTGDLGYMDPDGFFYFKLRMKRIIKSSGISVYPTQIEDVLNKHPAVRLSCVIGVPHPTKVQVPKGFVTLNEGWQASSELEKELIELCRKELMPHSCPRCIEFRDRLPLTLVGKVAYRSLEEQEPAITRARPARGARLPRGPRTPTAGSAPAGPRQP